MTSAKPRLAKSVPPRRRPAEPPRAWQRMLSGRRLDLLNPSPFDVEIEDIAHGLARVARWNGQTLGPNAFTVAQHSVVVEGLIGQLGGAVPISWRMMALLHDAPEYVIGDMISPFKAALGFDYCAFEDRLEAAIHVRFGLPPHPPAKVKALIKSADRICAHFEAVQLAGFSESEADTYFGPVPEGIALQLEPLPTAQAQAQYLARFACLQDGGI